MGTINGLGTAASGILATVAQTGAALDIGNGTNLNNSSGFIVINGYGVASNMGAIMNSGAGMGRAFLPR